MLCPYEQYNFICPFKTYKRSPIPPNSATPQPLVVTTKEITANTAHIKEHLRIPEFNGKVKPEILKNVNTNIRNDIMEFKSQLEAAAAESAKDSQKKGKTITPIEISNSYIVTYNHNNILSVSLIYEEYIGGRISYIRTTYNYDLQTGESMSLGSLFKKNVDYTNILNRKIRRILQASNQNYPFKSPYIFKGIAKDQPYYIDQNNLVIFFRFNEIAPSAAEIPTIKIPLIEIRDILAKNL